MWDDERIEAAIDEAARELTAGDPGPEFRARVMARIERAPRFQLGWRPIAVGLAVAAIVVIAVIWRPHSARQPPQTQEVRLKADPPYRNPDVTEGGLKRSSDGRSAGLSAPRVAALKGPRYIRTQAVDVPYGEGVAPLTTTPIDLESIAVPALTADESLRIDPLPPAPSIAVAPLVSEPEGDRR